MTYALVSGFARSFISGEPLVEATITTLENEQLKFTTDSQGRFGPFPWPVGEPLTLVCEKPGSFLRGYKTTQTATLIVPPEGINNVDYVKNVSFQVPSNLAYKLLSLTMGIAEKPDTCQIAATITPANTTMDNIPQGIAGVKLRLSPGNHQAFYFGMFPIIHKTNPCLRNLEATSLDGGVAFTNVPAGDYILEACKDDIPFTSVRIKARKGVVVNASPPFGPTSQREVCESPARSSNQFNFFKVATIAGITAGVCLSSAVISRL